MISYIVFLLVLLVEYVVFGGNNYCGLSCANGGGIHTVCQRTNMRCSKGFSCGPDFKVIHLNDNDRQYILDLHNYYRNKVATGNERRGNQPPATNMNTLTYNKELEFIAQCWINECHNGNLVHDKCRRTSTYSWVGQNLANMAGTNPKDLEKVAMIKQLTQMWYDEVQDFNAGWIDRHQQRNVMVGHYTQMVWAETKELGCAMSFYSYYQGNTKWYTIMLGCNYGPGGNFLGSPVYKRGQTASACGGVKNKRYQGLCGDDVRASQCKNYHNDLFNYHI